MYLQNQPTKMVPELAAKLSYLNPMPESMSDQDKIDLTQAGMGQALWDHSQKHGTSSLVYHNLKYHNQLDRLPDVIATAFQKSYYRTLANNLANRELLPELSSAFGDTPIILLKGLVLINTVYQNPALRPMTDIDLLVHPADLPKIRQQLLDLSFNPAPNYPDVFLRDNAQIDLHIHPFNIDRIQARDVATPLDRVEMWQHAQPFPDFPQFKQLDLPYQILTLAVHALKHGFERDIWLIDILGTLNHASTQPDWKKVIECSQNANADGILAYTIHAIQNRLQAPVLAPIENLQKSFPIGPIRRKILKVGNPSGDFQLLEPLVLMMATHGLLAKIRCLTEFIFPREAVLTQISGLSGKWMFYASYPLRVIQIVVRGSIQAMRLIKCLIFR